MPIDSQTLKKQLFALLALGPRVLATALDSCLLMLMGALGISLAGLRPGHPAWNLATIFVTGLILMGILQQIIQNSPGKVLQGMTLLLPPEEDALLRRIRLLLRHIVKWGSLGLCLYLAFQWFFPQQTGLPQGQVHTGISGIRLLYSAFLFGVLNITAIMGPGRLQELYSFSDRLAGTAVSTAPLSRAGALRSFALFAVLIPGGWSVFSLFPPAQQSNPTVRSYRESFLRDNMRVLQTTLEIYARDHDGQYPENTNILYVTAQRANERYESYWQDIENPITGKRGPGQAFVDAEGSQAGAVRYKVWKNRSGQYTQYALYALDPGAQLYRYHGQIYVLSNAR